VSSPDLLYHVGTDPWVRELCTGWRKTNKLLTTYLRVFPKVAREAPDGTTRIYASFKQTGTVTGRLSSSGPNLQNQPSRGTLGKRVRQLYQGSFVIGDYDQLEMRILAHVSGDPRLTKVFRDGEDPHVLTMRAIFGDVDPTTIAPGAALSYRDAAKQLNYAMGYGAGPKKIAQTLSLFGFPTTVEQAKGYLVELTKFYRVMFRWNENTKALAKRKGSVKTLGGHRRRLKGAFRDTANWKAVGYGERQAVNAIIQGTAADILRRTMVRADEAFPELKMLAQVHDEVIWEHPGLWLFDADPKMLPELQECMENGHGFDLKVPLVFEPIVTDSWAGKSGSSLVEVLADEEEEFEDAE
jgi:DNA polymerase-1